jgi:hypothetical protein
MSGSDVMRCDDHEVALGHLSQHELELCCKSLSCGYGAVVRSVLASCC